MFVFTLDVLKQSLHCQSPSIFLDILDTIIDSRSKKGCFVTTIRKILFELIFGFNLSVYFNIKYKVYRSKKMQYHQIYSIKWGVFWKNRVFSFSSVRSTDMRPKSTPRCQGFEAVWTCVGYWRVLEMFWFNVAEHFVPARSPKLANHANKAACSRVFDNVGSNFFISLCKCI